MATTENPAKKPPGLRQMTLGAQAKGADEARKLLKKLDGMSYDDKLAILLEAIPLIVNPSEGGRY